MERNLPMDLSFDCRHLLKGENNVNWKGGIAKYPNHYLMKKNRLIKLQQTKGKCEICNKQAYEIHHKDGTKENHLLSNLIVLCKRCHSLLHTGRKNKTSKFKRLYGMTIDELATKTGYKPGTIYRWHKQNRLAEFINFNA
ncbi:MAG TPA: HNH endonuclease [Candidatus Atribacteria bacterium]|nr:HNH endonuclease [Candidatus Atribacteria bacterium]